MSKKEDLQKEIDKLKEELEQLKESENQKQLKMFYIGTDIRYMGTVGDLTDIKDNKGEYLRTGDVIRLWGHQGEDNGTKSVVLDTRDNKWFIPGIKSLPEEGRNKLFIIEKVKDYKDVRKGYRTQKIVYCYSEEEAKEIYKKEKEFESEVLSKNIGNILSDMLDKMLKED